MATPGRPATSPSIALVVAVVSLVVATIVAFVVLELAGKDTTALTTFVAPIVGALLVAVGVGGYVGQRLSTQDATMATNAQVLQTISDQTNGKLDERMTRIVHGVLDAHGLRVPGNLGQPFVPAPSAGDGSNDEGVTL